MTETIDLICNRCKHTNSFRQGCDAFPEDIPMEILLSNEHSKPLPDQKNNIVFEPVKNNENELPIER